MIDPKKDTPPNVAKIIEAMKAKTERLLWAALTLAVIPPLVVLLATVAAKAGEIETTDNQF